MDIQAKVAIPNLALEKLFTKLLTKMTKFDKHALELLDVTLGAGSYGVIYKSRSYIVA